MGMRKNDSPSHFCRKTDTAIDKTVDELERIAREGGQRLFDIADSVLKSGESSSSENEDEGDDSANNVTEYIFPNKVIVTLSIPIPNSNDTHTQTDLISERIANIADANTSLKDHAGYYFNPTLPFLKFPKRSPKTTWAPHPTAPNTFIGTNPYVPTYTVTPIWIYEIHARRDPTYIKDTNRDFWTPAERRILYTYINEYIHENGMAAFKVPEGRKKAVFKTMKGMSVLRHLLEKTDAVRRGMENGGVDEWPEHAIPVKDFPKDTDVAEEGESEEDFGDEDENGVEKQATVRDRGKKREADDSADDDDNDDNQNPSPKRLRKFPALGPSSTFDSKTNSLIAKACTLADKETNKNSAAVFRGKTDTLVAKAMELVEREKFRAKEREEMGLTFQTNE
ncbi:hypothetical protein A1F97_10773 [Pyrenophora tritici-repentis]|nr:hypothetical protein A1F97_10773 [Pyrenophora tritici-repentis]